jgi:hypothetical protein
MMTFIFPLILTTHEGGHGLFIVPMIAAKGGIEGFYAAAEAGEIPMAFLYAVGPLGMIASFSISYLSFRNARKHRSKGMKESALFALFLSLCIFAFYDGFKTIFTTPTHGDPPFTQMWQALGVEDFPHWVNGVVVPIIVYILFPLFIGLRGFDARKVFAVSLGLYVGNRIAWRTTLQLFFILVPPEYTVYLMIFGVPVLIALLVALFMLQREKGEANEQKLKG